MEIRKELFLADKIAALTNVPRPFVEYVLNVAGNRGKTHFEELCNGCTRLHGLLSCGRLGANHEGIKEAVKDITGTSSKAAIDYLIREGE